MSTNIFPHLKLIRLSKKETRPQRTLHLLDVPPWYRSVVAVKPDMGYHPWEKHMDINMLFSFVSVCLLHLITLMIYHLPWLSFLFSLFKSQVMLCRTWWTRWLCNQRIWTRSRLGDISDIHLTSTKNWWKTGGCCTQQSACYATKNFEPYWNRPVASNCCWSSQSFKRAGDEDLQGGAPPVMFVGL